MIFCLAYEKPENIALKFLELKKNILSLNKDKNLLDFLNYVDNTYIGITKKALFDIKNWTIHSRIQKQIPTTTNISE